jgi:hypothetical protein
MRQMFFIVLLPDGTVVVPKVAKRDQLSGRVATNALIFSF